jgi:hypothetical protein
VLQHVTPEIVKQLYVSHEINSIMAGTKDYAFVNSKGEKVHPQK